MGLNEKTEKILRDKLSAWKRLALATQRLLVAATQGTDPGDAAHVARAAKLRLEELGEKP